VRDKRKTGTLRTPGLLRGPVGGSMVAGRGPVQHGARRWGFSSWRAFSGMIVGTLVAVLFLFFSADIFYIHRISVGGTRYLSPEEVYALSGVADMHVFWVDPEQVRQNVLRSTTIADVDVQVGWPPNMVTVIVQEREPALVWEQSGVTTWIDVQGRVMSQREDRADLIRVVSSVDDGPLSPNVQIGVDIVSGALQMRSLNQSLTSLRYDPIGGLGYNDARGWEAWFGTGNDMAAKIAVYNALVDNLQSRGITPRLVNVVSADDPFWCCR
jgi:hypothetical protein